MCVTGAWSTVLRLENDTRDLRFQSLGHLSVVNVIVARSKEDSAVHRHCRRPLFADTELRGITLPCFGPMALYLCRS